MPPQDTIDTVIERCIGGRTDRATVLFDTSYLMNMSREQYGTFFSADRKKYAFVVTQGVLEELFGKYEVSTKIRENIRKNGLNRSYPLRSCPPLYFLQQLGVNIQGYITNTELSNHIIEQKDLACTAARKMDKVKEPITHQDIEQIALAIDRGRTSPVVIFADDGHITETVPWIRRQENHRIYAKSHFRTY